MITLRAASARQLARSPVNTSWVTKARILLFPPADLDRRAADRSIYERFAIPYTFKPRLSLTEACVAATTAFLRIFLGCLLFAVCGTYALLAWSTIHSLFLRLAAVFALTLLFVVLFLLLLLAASAVTRIVSTRHD
jgi:hypothetical protein